MTIDPEDMPTLPGPVREWFARTAARVGRAAGSPWAFTGAVSIILMWGATGPVFGLSDTGQLVINTGTTIVTFLMVFLIQNSQNRDVKALHLKLEALIAGAQRPDNHLIDAESPAEAEIAVLDAYFKRLASKDWAKSGAARTRSTTRGTSSASCEPNQGRRS